MNEPLAGAPDQLLDVVKRGESCISMTFRRTGAGLTLAVKTHPMVEEFFRNLSTGEQVDVRSLGRHWTALQKDQPLMAYQIAEAIPIISLDGLRRVRFDRLSTQLLMHNNGSSPGSEQDINLGFLRLVGVGEGSGVTFTLKGVFSEDAVQKMRDAIAEGARRFYQTYMKPLNMNCTIVSSEW